MSLFFVARRARRSLRLRINLRRLGPSSLRLQISILTFLNLLGDEEWRIDLPDPPIDQSFNQRYSVAIDKADIS